MSVASTVAIAAVAMALPVVPIAAATVGMATLTTGASGIDCAAIGSATGGVAGYQADQMTNAATIVELGKQLTVPERGWVVAIATTMQESGLRNLDHGDRDSLGLFQQRPSQGWGAPPQIMDPTYSATQFYRHLLAVRGWQQMSINDAAQAVERSGLPHAYAQHEQAAWDVVHAVEGATCTPAAVDCHHAGASPSRALAAVTFACAQLGKPYVWGGNGDPGFDCSGLTHAAYDAAGIDIPRTAQEQYNAGPLLPSGTPLQPGDLIFFGTPEHIHHVAISLGGTRIVHAPDINQVVQVANYQDLPDFAGASRPTPHAANATLDR
jgi:cell wall-associated NlpC family hydrolase